MRISLEIHLLRVRLPEPGLEENFLWAGFDSQQTLLGSGNCALYALPPHKKLEWIVPATRVAAHHVPVPPRAGRHAMAIAMQALDDILLGEKEDAHIVLGKTAGQGCVAWTCSKQRLQHWMDTFTEAGLHPSSAYPEYALLSADAPTAGIAPGGNLIFRTNEGQYGYADSPEMLQALIGHVAIDHEAALLSGSLNPSATSLLTGPFSPRHRLSIGPERLRRSAWLLLAICAVLLFGMIVHWQQLSWRESNLKDEIRQTFATLYPGTPIIDPFLQWESKRREQRSGTRLDGLDQLSHFAQNPGNDLRPRSVEWRDGTIRLVINENDLARLRPRLQAEGREFTAAPAESGFSRLDIRMEKP